MIRWVITGPIGAGKSLASAYLVQKGAALVNADHLGHEVLQDPEVVMSVVEEFGEEVLVDGLNDRMIDRGHLGEIVFGDARKMAWLNALTHPLITRMAEDRLNKLDRDGQHELAVLEAAMYFLFPSPPSVDLVLSVVAEPEIRRQRLMDSRKLTRPEVEARMKTQTNLESLWDKGDVLLHNNGEPSDLYGQLDVLLEKNLKN